MRLLVVSDTHGRGRRLWDVLSMHKQADWLLFLGDGVRDVENCIDEFPHVTCRMVRGNNDWNAMSQDAPLIHDEVIAGKRILMMHGHIQQVKYGEEKALNAAQLFDADILLYGHTHQPVNRYLDGLYVLNPGSLGYDGTYGIIDITPSGVLTNIASL